MTIENEKIPDMLIDYKFGAEHKASSEFISLFNSIKLPELKQDELKELIMKKKMGMQK